MRVTWKPRALAQLRDIHAYIAKDNPRAAAAVVERIQAVAALLATYPLRGRRTDEADVRTIRAQPYTYRIFYRVDVASSEVRILRLRHDRQQS